MTGRPRDQPNQGPRWARLPQSLERLLPHLKNGAVRSPGSWEACESTPSPLASQFPEHCPPSGFSSKTPVSDTSAHLALGCVCPHFICRLLCSGHFGHALSAFLQTGAWDSRRSEATRDLWLRVHGPALPAPRPQHGLGGFCLGLSFAAFMAAVPLAPGLVQCVCVCFQCLLGVCVCVCVCIQCLLGVCVCVCIQ